MPASTTPVFCSSPQRRDRVRSTLGPGGLPLLNGIDYLEIANTAQTEIELHFIHPLPGQPDGVPDAAPALTPDQVTITGGERIAQVPVEAIVIAGNRLTLTVAAPGDFSIYTLTLSASPGLDTPPPGFDPQLSRIQFSFKATCPSDFDCQETSACAPTLPESPRIDYLARDYASYRRVLLDRLRLLMPQWTEDSPADFPIALTELLAHVGDQLAYAQDAAATEAYLGTARHRISQRRHARLRDYRAHEGCNARTWVHMTVEPGGPADGALIEVGQPFFAGTADQLALALAGHFDRLHPAKSAIFEAMEPLVVRATHNRFELYSWSDESCVLCQGATAATLRRPPGASLEPGMVLVFEEIRDPRAPASSQLAGRPSWRAAVRLTEVEEIEDPLNAEPLYQVAWDSADALPMAFVLSRRVDDTLIENITLAIGNVVLTDHGLTLEDNSADPSLQPRQAPIDGSRYLPRLTEAGLTHCQDLDQPESLPASLCLLQDRHQARPQVWLDSDGERWIARSDLLSSDGQAAEFVVEIDNQRRAQLRFGDNEHGRRPSPGQVFFAGFRIGNGARGNLGSDSMSAILRPGGGFSRVRNPLPATGGTDPEPGEEIQLFAPVAFRTQNRAVTLDDYAAMALRHPGVQQARAEFRWMASWYTVVIAVDRTGGLPLDPEFRTSLLAHLESYRMAGYDLDLREPVHVPLDIGLELCLYPHASRTQVFRELQERLGSGSSGLFHPDRLTFGQRIYTSQIIALASAVAGVHSVAVTRFHRFRQVPGNELEEGFLEVQGLELPQMANHPSFPERGRIEFVLKGGS
jgi:hypothetical protein